jgi:hypothetical protein
MNLMNKINHYHFTNIITSSYLWRNDLLLFCMCVRWHLLAQSINRLDTLYDYVSGFNVLRSHNINNLLFNHRTIIKQNHHYKQFHSYNWKQKMNLSTSVLHYCNTIHSNKQNCDMTTCEKRKSPNFKSKSRFPINQYKITSKSRLLW